MIHGHIIGIAKCGTTTLADLLSYHSVIRLARGKETHFFDLDEVFRQGDAYYHKIFGDMGFFNIDATPAYIRREVWLDRLRAYYTRHGIKPRLIVVLRDPTDRAVSHYLHRYRTGHETRDFFEVARKQMADESKAYDEWDQYIVDGEYRRIFSGLFQRFSPDEVHVISNIDLRKDPIRCLQAVLDFFDLPDQSEAMLAEAGGDQNVSASPKSLWFARLMARDGLMKGLTKSLLGRHNARRLRFFLTGLNRSNEEFEIAKLIKSDERLEELREYFYADVEFVRREFDIWL